ncbi:MAG: response regulator [Vicinamibacterales bacterium]
MPNRRRILLVEDELDTRAALFELFTRAGYSILTADDGQQALDLLMRGVRPRLIVVDLMLPNVSGTEFLTYIQTDPDLRAIPRIVVTALARSEVRVVADAIFHKPYEPAELLEAVKRIAPPGSF